MTAPLIPLTLGIGLLAFAAPLRAQISETEGSVALLAMNCSASSGYAASNYQEYCTRLARTLGVLSGEQQRRVFGYIPRPASVANAADSESDDSVEQTPGTNIPGTSNPVTESNASAGTPGTSGNSTLGEKAGDLGNSTSSNGSKGLIEQILGTANTAVTDTSNTVAPGVDGLTGIDPGSTTESLTKKTQSATSAGSKSLQDFWNSIISFFQALQARS